MIEAKTKDKGNYQGSEQQVETDKREGFNPLNVELFGTNCKPS